MRDEDRPRSFPRSWKQFTLFSTFSIILLLAILLPLSLAHAQSDFSMKAFFRGESLPQGSTDNYNGVNVTSVNGFSGSVSLTVSVSPGVINGPQVSFSIPTVSVPSGGNSYSQIVVSTASDTPVMNYTVTITGTSGALSHSIIIWVAVTVPYQVPDFMIQASPLIVTATLIPHAVVDLNSTLVLTSLYGFSGNVSLSFHSDPGPAVIITPSTVELKSGGTAKATVTLQAFQAGNYNVLVTGSLGGYPSHSIAVTFNVQPPPSDTAVLAYVVTYDSTPVPGGTLVLTNRFTNQGTTLVSVTGLSLSVGFGSYSPRLGLPLNLTSGESKTLPVTIQIPASTKLGNQSLTATIEWSYYVPGQGVWIQAPTKHASGSIQVSLSSAQGLSGQIQHLAGLMTGVLPWLLIPYAALTMSAVFLVVRQDRKNRETLRRASSRSQ